MSIKVVAITYFAVGIIVILTVEYIHNRLFPFDEKFNRTVQYGYDAMLYPNGKPRSAKVVEKAGDLIAKLIALPFWPVILVLLIYRVLRR